MDREEQARGKQSAGVARWFQAHVSYPNRVSNKPKVAAGVSRDDVDEVAAGAARRDAAGREHGVGVGARRALAVWLRSGRAEPVHETTLCMQISRDLGVTDACKSPAISNLGTTG